MKMKKLIASALALSMAAGLAGCGSAASSSSAASAAPAASAAAGGEKAAYTTDHLVVDIWDNNQLEGLQKIADEWTEQSGVKVDINVISWVEYWTLLEAGATGGELPDVFWMHINEAQKYMEGDVLLNLDSYIAADEKTDLSNYYEGIVDIYKCNGSQYALPKDHDTIALLYNKTIFDKYGVDYPTDDWTWDDYAAAAAKITEAGQADEGGRCSLYNGLGWAAAANTSDPQAAYDLISWFCSEEGQKKQSEYGVTMSGFKGASDAFPSAFEGMDISAFLKVEENGTLIQHPASRYTTRWEGEFTTEFVAAWQDPSTMEQVCRDMAASMNAILAEE